MKTLLTLPPSPSLQAILPAAGSMSAFILLIIIARLT